MDQDGVDYVDKADFGDVLNYCGLFLQTQEITSIYKQLDPKDTGINAEKFDDLPAVEREAVKCQHRLEKAA